MAGRERHAGELGDVPAGEDVAAAGRIVPEGGEKGLDLVVGLAVGPEPLAPLLAIDRAEFAPLGGEGVVGEDAGFELVAGEGFAGGFRVAFHRPVRPDVDALVDKGADVGAACQEPDEFLDGGFPEHALGGEERHCAVREVEAEQGAEQGTGADAGAVDALAAPGPDLAHEVLDGGFRMGGLHGGPASGWRGGWEAGDSLLAFGTSCASFARDGSDHRVRPGGRWTCPSLLHF